MQYTILVIDDSETSQVVASNILKLAGFLVETASSWSESLSKMSKVNAVFLDLNMPGLTGEEVGSTIHKYFPKIKIFIYSSENDERLKLAAQKTNAQGILSGKGQPELFLKEVKKMKSIYFQDVI